MDGVGARVDCKGFPTLSLLILFRVAVLHVQLTICASCTLCTVTDTREEIGKDADMV